MAPSKSMLGFLLIVGIAQISGKATEYSQDADFPSVSNQGGFEEEAQAADLSNGPGKNVDELLDSDNAEVGPTSRILYVPWWPSFLQTLIDKFHPQRLPKKNQFAVLFLGNVHQSLNDFPVEFYPQNAQGGPEINNVNQFSPSNVYKYKNYVAARPEIVSGTMISAEAAVLSQAKSLLDAYIKHKGQSPNLMVLYSWNMPLLSSINQIIDHFTQAPFANIENRVLAYSAEGANPSEDEKSLQRLMESEISVWREYCNRPNHNVDKSYNVDTDADTCRTEDTFQGCMVDCLGDDLCCSCKESDKRSMNAALVNDLTKECASSDIVDCTQSWVQTVLSSDRSEASPCSDVGVMRQHILTCANTCADRPLSKPIEPRRPDDYPGRLMDFSDISNIPETNLTDFCDDIRADGYYCLKFSAGSTTAGNTVCRKGDTCGYKGYSYSWCYVDFSNKWDYCCTSECGFGEGTDYMWCHSGSTWEYCGDAGSYDIRKQHCLDGYNCGMHQENGKASYYWCYVSGGGAWDRCCEPWDTCSKKGEAYDWCYTGYKRKTQWRKCTP